MAELVAVLAAGALIAAIAFALGRRSADQGATAAEIAQTPNSGALVPTSPTVWRPEISLAALGPMALADTTPAPTDPAIIVSFLDRLDDTLTAAYTNGELPTIAGPVARGLATLASNERLVGAIAGKAGYWIVKAPRHTTWMTAHGRPVAQASGAGGKAGSRAIVVGGTAVALTPELAALGAAALAEYILTVRIEQVGRVVSLVHQRQVNEALATADQARDVVKRIRAFSSEPTDWPEVLLHRLVECHHELARQASASDRIRDLIIGRADAAGAKQPRRPGTGDRGGASAELAAGYLVHTTAAQTAALRAEHAIAHGDFVTAQVVLDDLSNHLEGLHRHHEVVDGISEQRRRWFSQWGADVTALSQHYRPLVDALDMSEFRLLVRIGGTEPEVLALPTERPASQTDASESRPAIRVPELPTASVIPEDDGHPSSVSRDDELGLS